MGRRIYDKTTRQLLKDMVADWALSPGEVFTAARAVEWFAMHYPKLRSGSIHAHLTQASTNDPNRLHHPSTNESDDLLFRVASREYRLYQPGQDPAPIREKFVGDTAEQLDQIEADHEEAFSAENQAGSSEFLLEKDLQRYLAENLSTIEPGLQLYVDDDGVKGIEYEAGGGRRIDILAVDKNKALCVIELKVSKGYDRVIGQTLRYVNWIRLEVAEPGQQVRGMIVCRSMSEDLRLAAASVPDIELFEYELKVDVKKVMPIEIGPIRS